jgi:GT2 family glycosyltransferase
MITTRNRRDDLARTCAVLERLDPPPDEILVYADGCTDSTGEYLATKAAPYRIFTGSAGRGSIPNRDQMMREARAEIVLSLDDDSYPLEPDAIARIRELFEQLPSLAGAAFPQRTDEFPETLTATDFGPAQIIGSFASSSVALRRSVYLEVGGYETSFSHVYEEPDYALRCHAAGHAIHFEPILTVRHHFTGAQRNEIRNHQRQARNECWSVLMRCPWPWLPLVALFRAIRQFRYACKRGLSWIIREPAWWLATLRGAPSAWSKRHPLPWPKYLSWMRLLRNPQTLTDR